MTYKEFVAYSGFSEGDIERLVHLDNLMDNPNIVGTELKPSDIHGQGLFTVIDREVGDGLGFVVLNSERSNLGRFVNHSDTPNIRFDIVELGEQIIASIIKPIKAGEEFTVCYADNHDKQVIKPVVNYTPMEKMEIFLRSLPQFRSEFDVKTEFFPGSKLATRTLSMKAGDIVLGKTHTIYDVSVLMSGSLYVTNNPEGSFVRLDAPQVFETAPGAQKFVMCITDCVFMNIMHSENETADELLERMTVDSRITKTINKGLTCQQHTQERLY